MRCNAVRCAEIGGGGVLAPHPFLVAGNSRFLKETLRAPIPFPLLPLLLLDAPIVFVLLPLPPPPARPTSRLVSPKGSPDERGNVALFRWLRLLLLL
jgi:hypothetical protein